jgi:hypothetical protein
MNEYILEENMSFPLLEIYSKKAKYKIQETKKVTKKIKRLYHKCF